MKVAFQVIRREMYMASILRDIPLTRFKNSSSVQPLQSCHSYYHFSLLHYPQYASDTHFPLSLCLCSNSLTKTARWYRSGFAVLRLSLRNSVERSALRSTRTQKSPEHEINYWFRGRSQSAFPPVEREKAAESIAQRSDISDLMTVIMVINLFLKGPQNLTRRIEFTTKNYEDRENGKFKLKGARLTRKN